MTEHKSFFFLNLVLSLTPCLVLGVRSPIILVPGDGGSRLEARVNKSSVVHYICEKTADYFNIWLNLELLMPLVIDCWIDNVKLSYDNATRTTYNAAGVDIRIPGWGSPEPVEWLDPSHASAGSYFKDIGNALVAEGYQRNISLRGAPYDFRKAPNENLDFFTRMKTLVEDTFNLNNKSRVTLLTHSMGGPMALFFLQQQNTKWKSQYIERMITLSAPWGGAVKAVKVFAVGDDLGSYVLRQSILRQEQITSPSLAWLLPSPLFWKDSEILIQTDKFNYTLKDLQQFFNDIEFPIGWEMRQDTVKYNLDFSPPGVEVHCLYGVEVPTVERLVYKPGTWLDGMPTLETGNGDGTVNIRSLEGCQHWSKANREFWHYSKSKLKTVKTFPVSGVDHLGILRDQRVLDYIKTVMTN